MIGLTGTESAFCGNLHDDLKSSYEIKLGFK